MAKIVTDAILQAFDGQLWLPIGEFKDFQWSVDTATAKQSIRWAPSETSFTLTFSPWLPSAPGRRRRYPLHGGRLPKLRRGQRIAPAWLVRRKKATKLRARWV